MFKIILLSPFTFCTSFGLLTGLWHGGMNDLDGWWNGGGNAGASAALSSVNGINDLQWKPNFEEKLGRNDRESGGVNGEWWWSSRGAPSPAPVNSWNLGPLGWNSIHWNSNNFAYPTAVRDNLHARNAINREFGFVTPKITPVYYPGYNFHNIWELLGQISGSVGGSHHDPWGGNEDILSPSVNRGGRGVHNDIHGDLAINGLELKSTYAKDNTKGKIKHTKDVKKQKESIARATNGEKFHKGYYPEWDVNKWRHGPIVVLRPSNQGRLYNPINAANGGNVGNSIIYDSLSAGNQRIWTPQAEIFRWLGL